MKELKDTYRQRGLRKRLVKILKEKGIQDEKLLAAFGKLPRHHFLDNALDEWAYKDQAMPIGCEQTISQPYTVAFQTALLEIEEGDKVLEIGTGSGYQAAILDELGAKVYTIERHKELFHSTNELLKQIGKGSIRTFHQDGTEGLPRHAPFDKILVTAAAEEVPQPLIDQLKPGGYMVVPVGGSSQKMIRIKKNKDGSLVEEVHGYFRFVPLLKGKVDE